jgi:hypothetical protein
MRDVSKILLEKVLPDKTHPKLKTSKMSKKSENDTNRVEGKKAVHHLTGSITDEMHRKKFRWL